MIEQNLSLLLVVVPLLAAPIAAMLPNGRLPWLLTLAVSWLCFILAAWQLMVVIDGDVIQYSLGGWAPPWGIEYRIDALNAIVALLVAGLAAVTLPYAMLSIEQEIHKEQLSLFYSVFLLCIVGLLGITQTGDIFNLFVFLEISSLSSYALIAMGRDRRALTAAFQYMIMGTIGATFFLIGVGLTYAETGTLNMLDLNQRLHPILEHRTVHTGFAFMVVGIALKLALFPLHLWLPNVYTYAPTAISVFLAATATKVAVYVMLRVVFGVFSNDFVSITPADDLFLLLGVIGVIMASAAAITQRDVKRMLAYSSVAQISYMVLGMGFASVYGLTASIVHIFNHALMKGALFMAVGIIVYRVGSSQFKDMAGLGRQMPWTFAAIFIAGLSLIGVPGTAGFISKWYLMLAAIEQQAWPIALAILIGSMLAVIYMWRLIETLFFKEPEQLKSEQQEAEQHKTGQHKTKQSMQLRGEAPLSLLVPLWILVLANIYFGVETEVLLRATGTAVDLLGVANYHE